MTWQEKIQYPANLYSPARAANCCAVEWDYLLQEIAKEIDAGCPETRKALGLSMEKISGLPCLRDGPGKYKRSKI